ncbi:unnamed protein product (macronuclear) [Paramecium tetraurelia]|uniref:Cache domain-containing protein n=1 Tax=Paramecium tetraurelia TaxID=5888 RepID=A0DBF8_PARTE|nr:uncharacterized protein GSPATT00015270001 [Paramecium tetraurelia]CAK80375.1 unnamed protein product [Paramecium tetraurelia]|eukprot:XP_001447772.1 hypothetical protein (macronuclear) [Paramecium tetraurelia strain d4-2]
MMTLLAVLSLSWINYYVQTEIFSVISSSSLNQILQSQDQDQIGFIAQNIAIIVEFKFVTVLKQIESIKNFYSFFENEKQNIANNQKLNSCVSVQEFLNDKRLIQSQRFCYYAIGVPDYTTLPQNEEEVFILNDFISFLNHYSLVINVPFTGKLQIASISSTKYFAQFPSALLVPAYDITTRFWYKNHIDKTEADSNTGFVFSPLNDAFASQIKEMSITNSLYKDNKMFGIIKEGLLVSNQLIPTVPYNVLLLDQDGLVVYFNMEQLINKTNYFYIYDQNITGFNQTDWEEMIQFSNQRDKVILVLENKLQKEKVNIYSLEVLKNNFTLVVYTNITTKIDYQSQSQVIRDKSFIHFTYSFFTQIFLGVIAIALQIIVLLVVFKPLKQFISIIKQYTLSQGNNINSEIFKMIHTKSQKQDALSNLQNKLLSFSQILTESQGRKCEMCKIWESFAYNENDPELEFDEFRNQFNFIQNERSEFGKKMLKQIKLGIC